MNFSVSRKAIGFLFAGAVVSFVLFGFPSGEDSSNQAAPINDESPLVVQTLIASPVESYAVTRRFIGRVEAGRESDLGFELPGMLDEISVDEGSQVSKGQVIARLNTELLAARQKELVSVRDSARAQLNLATSTLTRVKEASALDAVSSQSLDEAESALANATAAFAAADSSVNTLNVQIRRSEMLAPFDGVVSQRFLDEGRVAAAGEPVVRVLESANPEIRLAVAQSSAEQLIPQSDYEFNINGKSYIAKLKAVLPERQNVTRGVEALFELEVPFASFRRGDLAEIALVQKMNQRGFELPITALTESARGIWAVYVAEPAGDKHILNRRQLEILHQEGDTVVVRGTLSEGEAVVSAGLHRLMPGQTVTLSQASTIKTVSPQ